MSLDLDLNGKRALVSGVSSGIGGGIAQILARAGCDVSGCGLHAADSEGAHQFVNSVEKEGRKAQYLSLDLTDPGEITRWVESAVQFLEGIDILISNAGRNDMKGVESCSEAEWEDCMNLNLAAHWRLARSAYPYLKKNGNGVIVVITSNHAYSTMPGCFPYNVAKAGLVAMVQSFAIEWGPAVRAVAIAPGFTETPALAALYNTKEAAAEIERIKALHPLNKMGSVEEIGALCAFLASEGGGFITGTTFLADGGRSALMMDSTNYG